jgi:shikimate 5-dehydrogenase
LSVFALKLIPNQSISRPAFVFLGVSTSQSLGHRVFPRWLQIVGAEADLLGVDLPLNASPPAYRQVVQRIKGDDKLLGALVTSHKANLFEHAADLFDEFSPDALALREISPIYKVNGRLAADAIDAAASRRVLASLIPEGYWRDSRAQALILGAGGAGVALAYALLTDANNVPAHVILTETDPARANLARAILQPWAVNASLEVLHVGEGASDRLLAALPEGSLVVNATGMGKDRPGSPISGDLPFPMRGLAWEFNYRGERQFLEQARGQAGARDLTVEDGWRLFICGWSFGMSRVFAFEVDEQQLAQFAQAAEGVRGGWL